MGIPASLARCLTPLRSMTLRSRQDPLETPGATAGHQREQQQPCLELASSVPELAYLPAVQRPAGGVADHRAVGEISPHVGWIAREVPERAVLRLTAAGDRAAEPDQAGLRRVPSATPLRPVARPPHREPLGDVQHSEWRALGIRSEEHTSEL